MIQCPTKTVELRIPQSAVISIQELLDSPSSLVGSGDPREGGYTGMELGPSGVSLFFEARDPVQIFTAALTLIPKECWGEVQLLVTRGADTFETLLGGIGIEEFSAKAAALDRVKKRRGRSVRVLDCFAIPLPDGRFGHCQYAHTDEELGDYLRVFDIVDHRIHPAEELHHAGLLFPIILTAVKVCVEVARWRFIGRTALREPFRYPSFRISNTAIFQHTAGVYNDWSICDGPCWEDSRFVGRLPSELRELEFRSWWPPQDIARRIVEGYNPFANYQ